MIQLTFRASPNIIIFSIISAIYGLSPHASTLLISNPWFNHSLEIDRRDLDGYVSPCHQEKDSLMRSLPQAKGQGRVDTSTPDTAWKLNSPKSYDANKNLTLV